MYSDFDLICHRHYGNDDIKIIPISDLHVGAKEFMEDEWKEFCNNVMNTPNVFITLGGDLMNNATKSSVSNIFDDTMRPRDQKRYIVNMLEPIKSRILCGVAGNHERRSTKDADDDPMYDIMCKLDLEHLYRENIAFMKIQICNNKRSRKCEQTYTIGVTHGSGGGIYTGASVNRNERFGYIIDGLDCLIVGHSHKPFITQPNKINIDIHNNKISFKPFKVVSSTSWLNYGGYAAQKMLLPSSHCLQTITLCKNHKEILVEM